MTPTKDVSRFDYLRGRPFLCVSVSYHPADNVRTERKDWRKQKENIALKEHPLMVDAITNKIMCTATIIIDILHNKIVKNRLRLSGAVDPAEFDQQALEHFNEKYRDIVEQGKSAWAFRLANA